MVVDPNELDPTGGTSIDWYVASPDGKLVAVSLSQGGTEAGDVHVYRRDTGQRSVRGRAAREHRHRRRRPGLDARRPRLLLHAASLAGRAAGGGSRLLPAGLLPRARHEPQRRSLRDGQGLAADRRDSARRRQRDGPRAGDGAERRRRRVRPLPARVRTARGSSSPTSKTASCRRSSAGTTICSWSRCAMRRAARSSTSRSPTSARRRRRSSSRRTRTRSKPASSACRRSSRRPNRLYVVYQLGGPSEIRAFDHAGKPVAGPEQTPVAAFYDLEPLAGDDLLFGSVSYVQARRAATCFTPRAARRPRRRSPARRP